MNYSLIFLRLRHFIAQTQQEWVSIAQELKQANVHTLRETGLEVDLGLDLEKGQRQDSTAPAPMHPLNDFALPFIGLAAVLAYVGNTIAVGNLNFQNSLVVAGITYISLYLGILASIYVLEKWIYPAFQMSNSKLPGLYLGGYSSIYIVFSFLLVGLFPSMPELILLGFITIYPLSVGINKVMDFPANKSPFIFGLLCSLSLILCPILLKILLTYLAKQFI